MTYDEAEKLHHRLATDTPSSLRISEAMELDRFVKMYTLDSLKTKLKRLKIKKELRDFVYLMCRCHFGSSEVDALLCDLKCYPGFMIQ